MIKEKLSLVPNKPGCYLMKNKDNVIIYVGKAKKLKNRLSSYFRGTHTGKTGKLVSEIVDFEYIVVGSETESLILELNLIKKYDPKYNILLRDDKSYPYIELTNEKVPRLLVVRNVNRKKNHNNLYGPYPNVYAAKKTVELLNRIYPLRKCKTYNKKPCLYYHIGQCLGYCTNTIDEEKIKDMKTDIIKFLRGDDSEVIEEIKKEMKTESDNLRFEKAQELKELLDYINITLKKQKVEIKDNIDRDIFGFYVNKGYISIQVFFIRSGKILERHKSIFPLIDNEDEELTRYIANFYQSGVILPKEILVPSEANQELLESFLKVNVRVPLKGEKLNLIKMANENAEIALNEEFDLIEKNEQRTYQANEELKNILKLEKLDRIELFDNSNLFGNYNVSGMVVYKNGIPSKNDYRKFKISFDKNDDYNTMKEVTYRRYYRALVEHGEMPDLILVDGGINQIHAVKDTIDSLHLNIKVCGLVKNDKHRTNELLDGDTLESYKIDYTSNLFHYLTRIQDEVHRFTINYHRELRSKGSIKSLLDNVDGIGNVRKKELMKKYGSVKKINEASIEELDEILPHKVSEYLKNYLNSFYSKENE